MPGIVFVDVACNALLILIRTRLIQRGEFIRGIGILRPHIHRFCTLSAGLVQDSSLIDLALQSLVALVEMRLHRAQDRRCILGFERVRHHAESPELPLLLGMVARE